MNTPLCVSPFCGLPRRHRDDCDGEGFYGGDCRGCLPARADDGAILCRLCTLRLAHDAWSAAWRHAALGMALTASGGPGEYATGATKEPGISLNAAAVQARDDIRSTLVAVCRVVVEERGITPPDDRVTAMARFVRTHARWLAAHPAADEHARDLRDIATDPLAWRIAFPSSSDRLFAGTCHRCGSKLYQLPDQPLITCRGCGQAETWEWWQRQIMGETGGVVDILTAAAHLTARWHLVVEPRDIRDWVARGKVNPMTYPDPADPSRRLAVRDERGRSLFEMTELMIRAEQLWGPPMDGRTRRRSTA